MSSETLTIRANGVLYTPFGSFPGSTEFLPSLSFITFYSTASVRLNNSLLAYAGRKRGHILRQYYGSSMTCKTGLPGTGFVTFYMFRVRKVILAQSNKSISSLQVIGKVISKCTCFIN